MKLIEEKPIPLTISIRPTDLAALKRMSAVSHRLAEVMGNERVQREQERLSAVLDDVVAKIEVAMRRKAA